MKVVTVLGTRPEFIRLCLILRRLDTLCDHVVMHTGQNYDASLNDVFFKELSISQPNYFLQARGTFGEQLGIILTESERILQAEKPDRFLVLGDTNSSLAAIMAKRLAIPVYHMEAGNRCYDDRVPEETNRRIIDHSSDVLMPYSERSRANLLREGIEGRRIYVIGNPIFEVLEHFRPHIEQSVVLDTLGLGQGKYFLVTMHRAENVDVAVRLTKIIEALQRLRREYQFPIICSLHPRTKQRLQEFGLEERSEGITFVTPLGFFDFIRLEKSAFCVLTDSGTVQEECCIMRIPNVTVRDTTERPETVEAGSNMISGVESDSIVSCVHSVLEGDYESIIPPEYSRLNVSKTVTNIVLGKAHMRL